MSRIKLTQGKEAIIDDCDAERCSIRSWYAVRYGHIYYAQAKIGGKPVFLHHFLFGKQRLDHRNGNGLDNRSENVRPCTHKQNMANRRKPLWASGKSVTSQHKGVHYDKTYKSWKACIETDGKAKWLGSFKTERDAAMAYNSAASEVFGSFARLNPV